MAGCSHCDRASLLDGLGRCRACMHKAALFALCCWLLWGWLKWNGAEPVSVLAALVGALGLTALTIAHLAVAWWRRK